MNGGGWKASIEHCNILVKNKTKILFSCMNNVEFNNRLSVLRQVVQTSRRWTSHIEGRMESLRVPLGKTGFAIKFFRRIAIGPTSPPPTGEVNNDNRDSAIVDMLRVVTVIYNDTLSTLATAAPSQPEPETSTAPPEHETSTAPPEPETSAMDTIQSALSLQGNIDVDIAERAILGNVYMLGVRIVAPDSTSPLTATMTAPSPVRPVKSIMAWSLETPDNIDVACGPIWTCPLVWSMSLADAVSESVTRYLFLITRYCEECGLFNPNVSKFKLHRDVSKHWCNSCAYSYIAGISVDTECILCMKPMTRPYESICGHMFHRGCGVAWAASSANASCPICDHSWGSDHPGFILTPFKPALHSVALMPRNVGRRYK